MEGFRKLAADAELQEQQRHAAISELLTGPAVRHLLAVGGWSVEHDLSTDYVSPCASDRDEPMTSLDCRSMLPRHRRGEQRHMLLDGPGPDLADDEREPVRGTITFSKREMRLRIGEGKAAFLCSALAAGRIGALDLEVVRSPTSPETIRWIRLCTRTHDGAEVQPEMS